MVWLAGTKRHSVDVVIVGAGIAGSALGAHLASNGVTVMLVEASAAYTDRVRGEGIMPWGVLAAKRLGVLETLRAAGALPVRTMINYANSRTTAANESSPAKLDGIVDGTGGGLNIRHPVACQALSNAAQDAGAVLHRGATEMEIGASSLPTVRFKADGEVQEVQSRLIVGADGRGSMVRRAFGIDLQKNRGTNSSPGCWSTMASIRSRRKR